MRNAVQIMMLQVRYRLIGYPDTVGTNLLIITDHHQFLCDIKQEEALNAELACFVDDHKIVAAGRRVDHFSHEVSRHNPDRNCLATLVHILPRFPPKPLDPGGSASTSAYCPDGFAPAPQSSSFAVREAIKEIGPGTQRRGFTEQCADRAVGFVAALPQPLPITDIRALAQPIFGDSPSPRGLPFSEPVVPRLCQPGWPLRTLPSPEPRRAAPCPPEREVVLRAGSAQHPAQFRKPGCRQ